MDIKRTSKQRHQVRSIDGISYGIKSATKIVFSSAALIAQLACAPSGGLSEKVRLGWNTSREASSSDRGPASGGLPNTGTDDPGVGSPGAGSSGPDAPTTGVAFSLIQTQILNKSCIACHGAGNPAGGYNLTTYAGVMAGGRVVAGNSARSALYTEVRSDSMPAAGAPVSAELKAMLAKWIDEGALETPAAGGGPVGGGTTEPAPTEPTPTPQMPGGDGREDDDDRDDDDDDDGGVTLPPPTTTPTPAPTPVGGGATPPATTATFQAVQTRILNVYCMACHSGTRPSAGYNVSTYTGVMRMVSAGNASRSTIYSEVSSNSMPASGGPLPTELKTLLRDWINAGALNN